MILTTRFHLEPLPNTQEFYYGFHPDFLERELTLSLSRLQTPYLDSYLVQNPEFILNSEIPLDASERDLAKYREKAVDKVYEKLTQVFASSLFAVLIL